jgi:hypothetical protein
MLWMFYSLSIYIYIYYKFQKSISVYRLLYILCTLLKFILDISMLRIVEVMVTFSLSFEFTITSPSDVLAHSLFTLYVQQSLLIFSALQLSVVSYGSCPWSEYPQWSNYSIRWMTYSKKKGKVHCITCHEGAEWE